MAKYDDVIRWGKVGICTMLKIFRLENKIEELKWVIKDERKRGRTKRS